ncbi:hypothetical protein [Amycolatopsis aidingensis]|uniref:hypothetical protein n=1 Tax=Amycolatopsis aidingensis TaxID=2842453 RepID=UPI001C0B455C|nr:hypothetical protein [Amycolatopsis aidingensis]
MRNPARQPVRILRAGAIVTAVPVAVLLAGPGSAMAQGEAEPADVAPNEVAFGLLGPVGLIAVALGIVGMALGVLRQRRKAREHAAAVVQAGAETPEPTAADLTEEATRPMLTPAPRSPVG